LHFYLVFWWRSDFSGGQGEMCRTHLSFILEPKTCIKGKGSPLHQQSVRDVFSARCLHLFASHREGLDYLCWLKVHFLSQKIPLVGGLAGFAAGIGCVCCVMLHFCIFDFAFSTVDYQEFYVASGKGGNWIHCNTWHWAPSKTKEPMVG